MIPAVFSQSPDKYQGLVVDWATALTASGLSGGGALDGVIAIRLMLGALTIAQHRGDALTKAELRNDSLVRS